MMFPQSAVGADLHLNGDNVIRDKAELERLNAGLIADDFLGILQSIAAEIYLQLSAALGAGRKDGSEVRRGSVGQQGQQEINTKHQTPSIRETPSAKEGMPKSE